MQNKVLLDNTGLSVAKGLAQDLEKPFIKKSMELTDGPNGNEGGIGVIRAGKQDDELCLVMKYGAQGMGHGHYDKLSFSMYNKANEVLQDYGAARFVNIDQKYGGAYLPENNTWAKQSVAHNTLVVNETSHFNGDFETGNKYHSYAYFFNATGKDIQIMSAKDTNAYPGTAIHRTMAVIEDKSFEKPLIIDVLRVKSEKENQYDLPYWFIGQVMNTDFEYSVPSTLSPLGKDFGYQHLWKTGEGKAKNKNVKLNWFSNERFYTITTIVSPEDKLLFAQLGAKDPLFNLRRDQSFIIRKNKEKSAIFVSVIETNGHYDPVNEISSNSFSNITDADIMLNNEHFTVITWGDKTGKKWILNLANEDASSGAKHHIELAGRNYDWTGPFNLTKSE
jgi:hypothetical protein